VVVSGRTHVTRYEADGGRWLRATRDGDPRLRPLLDRPYVGFRQERAAFGRWLEPPPPALTLVVDLGEPIAAGGRRLPDAWVGGLSDTYELVDVGPGYASVDLKLTPLGAYRLLGVPLDHLAGAVVALDDVLGAPARELAEVLRATEDWDERFDALDAFLLARAADGPRPSAAVAWAWSRLRATAGRERIGTLAAEIGWSRRHLVAKFREQVGLTPKTVARLLRFAELRARVAAAPVRWADVAYDLGYADQAHLAREFRELAGITPTDFLARQVPGGGLVGDGVTNLQDAA
jgi:AraC-like DNA-binding protein